MNINLPEGYQLKTGTKRDRDVLLTYMKLTYQELYPQQDKFEHLKVTISQYFSHHTPLWLLEITPNSETRSTVGCLWMGRAIDQKDGESYPHIFLLFVNPEHRRRGLGKALIQVAENYARSQGDRAIGLQVFANNQAALGLYQNAGFEIQSVSMIKPLKTLRAEEI